VGPGEAVLTGLVDQLSVSLLYEPEALVGHFSKHMRSSFHAPSVGHHRISYDDLPELVERAVRQALKAGPSPRIKLRQDHDQA
jgi:hypothetical protein